MRTSFTIFNTVNKSERIKHVIIIVCALNVPSWNFAFINTMQYDRYIYIYLYEYIFIFIYVYIYIYIYMNMYMYIYIINEMVCRWG